jgi:hypothetical protein
MSAVTTQFGSTQRRLYQAVYSRHYLFSRISASLKLDFIQANSQNNRRFDVNHHIGVVQHSLELCLIADDPDESHKSRLKLQILLN